MVCAKGRTDWHIAAARALGAMNRAPTPLRRDKSGPYALRRDESDPYALYSKERGL
jgi:hypothetical protein